MTSNRTYEAVRALDRLYQALLRNRNFRGLMTIYQFFPQATGKLLEMVNANGDLVEVHQDDTSIFVIGKDLPVDLTEHQLIEEISRLIDFVQNYQ